MCRSINIIILIIVIFLPSFIPIQEDSPIHSFFHSLTPFTLNNIIPRALNPSLLPHRLLLLFAKAAIQWLRYHGTLCNPQGRWRSATGCNGDNIIRVQNFIAIELKHFLVIRRSTSSPFFLNRGTQHDYGRVKGLDADPLCLAGITYSSSSVNVGGLNIVQLIAYLFSKDWCTGLNSSFSSTFTLLVILFGFYYEDDVHGLMMNWIKCVPWMGIQCRKKRHATDTHFSHSRV